MFRAVIGENGPGDRGYELVLCAAIGALSACAVLVLAPPAQDLAGHVYRTALVDQGSVLWDNYWYTGDYPLVGYSVLVPPLSALTGLSALLVASTAASGALFATVALREWGGVATWPARAFAMAAALPLLPGLDAYVVAVPCVLGALAALQRRRRGLALVCAALALAGSSLAFLFLLVVAASIVLAGRCERRAMLVVGAGLALLAALEGLLMLFVFPSVGVYPFLFWHLLAVATLALGGVIVAFRDHATRPIALLLGGWGVASVGSYLVVNPVGDNVARLRYAVFPLMLLVALHRERRRLAAILAVAALVYAAAPDLMQVSEQADARSARPTVWEPTIRFLRTHLPVGARVEVVPTSARWEAFYLPSEGIPLARGWFRQTDMARNRLFYLRRLSATQFRQWLSRDAVQYVVLTPFPLDDHGASLEARLLRSGHSGLRIVRRQAGFTVYVSPTPAHLLTGPVPAHLTRFTHERIAGTTPRAGVDSLRVWFSPYWTTSGAAGCVGRGPHGMSVIRFDRRGTFSLSISHDPLTIAARAADFDC